MNGIDLAGLRLMAIGTLSVLAAAGVVVVLDNGPEETPSPVTTTLRPTTTTSTSSTSTSSTSTSTSTSTSISVSLQMRLCPAAGASPWPARVSPRPS